MKKALIISSVLLLTGAVLYACGMIPNANTSYVTIKIGDNPQKAMLTAEAATPLARLRHVFAGINLIPEAKAYIPSVVQLLVVTVTASDIAAPIVGVESVKETDGTATVRIEVPNGTARSFLVEGYRGIDNKVYFRGAATADLTGADITLQINMGFVGPGIWVNNQHPSAADTPSCGTESSPCITITHALNTRTTGTDAVVIAPGTYSSGEIFPLQLRPNTALVCLGTVTIDAYNSGSDAVYGDNGASVNNCTVIPDCDWTAIDDTVGGWNSGNQPAKMSINGVVISSSSNCPAWDAIILSGDSTVIETQILDAWSSYVNIKSGKPVIKNNQLLGTINSTNGIYIASGTPLIEGNTITGMYSFTGSGIAIFGGDPTIISNVISNNPTGISIQSTGKPIVSRNRIENNNTGVSIQAGDAELSGNTITNTMFSGIGVSITSSGAPRLIGNSIYDNFVGVDITVPSTGTPRLNDNSIFCNPAYDVGVNATSKIDLKNNAWDHAATTNPPGPIVDSFGYNGEDIVVTAPSPTPDYSGAVAAPNGCLPYPVPVGKPAVLR